MILKCMHLWMRDCIINIRWIFYSVIKHFWGVVRKTPYSPSFFSRYCHLNGPKLHASEKYPHRPNPITQQIHAIFKRPAMFHAQKKISFSQRYQSYQMVQNENLNSEVPDWWLSPFHCGVNQPSPVFLFRFSHWTGFRAKVILVWLQNKASIALYRGKNGIPQAGIIKILN